MTLMTGVAVAEALTSLTDLDICIKWPNDILIKGKKIAGILTEISTDMCSIDYVIVGLGININTPRFPDDIKDIATSLFLETGKNIQRITFLTEYLKWNEYYYNHFQTTGFGPIMKRWKEFADIIGRKIRVEMIDKEISGEVKRIDQDGTLVLEDEEGKILRVFSGDVYMV